MKILSIICSEVTSPGGVHKTIAEIAKNNSKRGHEVTVLQTNPLNLPEEELFEGFKIIRVKSRLGKYLYDLSLEMPVYLKKHYKNLNPDIIHVHGYHNLFSLDIINLIRQMDQSVPIVFSPYLDTFRSTLAGEYLWNLHKLLSRSLFKKSSATVSCSKFEADYLINNFNVEENKISVIPLGVDMLNPQKKRGNKNNTINLIYSGYLIDRKGVDFLLNTLNYLVNILEEKNVMLTIIGEGSKKKSLIKLSLKLKLEDHVIWKNFLSREKFINEIINADILMLLSKSEAYGIIVAEALALGTPCIVTNNTSLTDFTYENGCFGVNYPPDPFEVAKLILRIHESDISIGPLSSKIRTWDKVAKDYENLYASLIKEE